MNDPDQFQAIVCEYYTPLFRFAMSLTRVESDAQDLTQETFHAWATKGHQLRDLSKVRAWLYTTLHRIFLTARRRETKFCHYHLEEVSEELPIVSPEQLEQMDFSEVLSALARVDEAYKPAVALFYLDDCSYKDIAAILEVPIGTVKSRIARGITQLRKLLLSEDSRTSFFREPPISNASVADEPAALAENGRAVAPLRFTLQTRAFERSCSPIQIEECLSTA